MIRPIAYSPFSASLRSATASRISEEESSADEEEAGLGHYEWICFKGKRPLSACLETGEVSLTIVKMNVGVIFTVG